MAQTAAAFAGGTRLSDHLSVIVRVHPREAVRGTGAAFRGLRRLVSEPCAIFEFISEDKT